MNKRDSETNTPAEPRTIRGAILRPTLAADALRMRRLVAPAALAPFVSHFWFIDWDLPEPFTQSVLPNPAVNLVAEREQLSLSGVWTHRYDRHLDGRGSVYGVNFRPAGFHALWRRPVHELCNRSFDLAPELGLDAPSLHARLVSAPSDDARCEQLAELLARLEPAPYPQMEALNELVELAREDRELTSAEALAARAGLSLRSLQRRLRTYVGISPKALLRRYRLQEAAARLAEGEQVDQAQLAASLGYADQAHFTRDFKASVGAPPRAYAKSLARDHA